MNNTKTGPSVVRPSIFLLIEDGVLSLFLCSVAWVFSTTLYVNFTLPKLLAFRFCAALLMACWIWRIRKGQTVPLPRPVFWSGILLGGWWIFTSFFALHRPTALHGVYGRYNGLFTHELWLLTFFAVATIPLSRERLKRILCIFISVLLPVTLYAVAQFLGLDPFLGSIPEGRSAATIGHPVTLAALIGLALPFAAVFIVRTRTKKGRLAWAGVFLFLFLGAVTTISRGPLIGIFVALVMVAGSQLKNRAISIKRIAASVTLFVVISSGLLLARGAIGRFWNRVTSGLEVKIRMICYRTAIGMVKDYPVLGAGFEHFRILYPRYRLAEANEVVREAVPTKVHNGYIQAALSNGIPGLLLYLVFAGTVMALLIRSFRRETDGEARALMAAFLASITGFLIQDLTGWLEISLTTFFWLILGLGVAACGMKGETVRLAGAKKAGGYAATILTLLLCGWSVFDSVERIGADSLFWNARSRYGIASWDKVKSYLAAGMKLAKGDYYYEDLAGQLYFSRFIETKDNDSFKKAIDNYEKAYRDNPFDSYTLIHRIEAEAAGLRRGVISKASDFAEQSVDKLLDMDRNNPAVYESIAKLKVAQKREKEALAVLDKGGAPSIGDRKYLILKGDVYIEMRQFDKAIDCYNRVSLLYDMKRVGKEPFYTEEWIQTIYGYVFSLAGGGRLAEALAEIESLISLFPTRAHAHVVKGQIQAAMNEIEKARDSFASALRLEPNNQLARQGFARAEKILQTRYRRD